MHDVWESLITKEVAQIIHVFWLLLYDLYHHTKMCFPSESKGFLLGEWLPLPIFRQFQKYDYGCLFLCLFPSGFSNLVCPDGLGLQNF